jgi:hypothetical protein
VAAGELSAERGTKVVRARVGAGKSLEMAAVARSRGGGGGIGRAHWWPTLAGRTHLAMYNFCCGFFCYDDNYHCIILYYLCRLV